MSPPKQRSALTRTRLVALSPVYRAQRDKKAGRGVAVAALVAASALLAGGCGRKAAIGTAGDKLNVCNAVQFYSGLQPPKPSDAAAVRTYAHDFGAIVDHVNFNYEYKNQDNKLRKPSVEVRNDFGVMRRALDRFRTEVGGATGAALLAAQSSLADNKDFTSADRRLQDFYRGQCS
jgi:hypothetical protein